MLQIFNLGFIISLILLVSCDDSIKDLEEFVDWSLDTTPMENISDNKSILSSDTLVAMVKLEQDIKGDNELDLFTEEDVNLSRVLAIINIDKQVENKLDEKELERLEYVAQAQIQEEFDISIVSELHKNSSEKITEQIKKFLLSYNVKPIYIKIIFGNLNRNDSFRIKILKQ